MKKIFCIALMLFMCMGLTGCFGLIADVNIKGDGSGIINAKMGFSEEGYKILKSFQQSADSESQEEPKPFVHNGKTYYGESDSRTFSNVEEFNSLISSLGGDQVNISSNGISLIQNVDGSLNLTMKIDSQTTSTPDQAEEQLKTMNLSQEEQKKLLEDMVMIYTFKFPENIRQTSGDTNGITINNDILEIDFLKLTVPQENTEIVYNFTTQAETIVKESNKFIDVPETLWSYKAISVLADGGLVSGVGDGKFSPERGMKIAEFCQVLANAMGLESGSDETGYWAAKAIKSCIEKGYIYSQGEVNPENYNRIITREEAIAAMQLASMRSSIENDKIKLEDIPDGNEIDEKYREAILQAYNSGITTGVNAQLKFSPKSNLTRGQVCQLFYNVNWTTSLN